MNRTIFGLLLLSIFVPNLALARNYMTLCEDAGGAYFGPSGGTPRDCVCEQGSSFMHGKSIDQYWSGLGGGFVIDCYYESCDSLGQLTGTWSAFAYNIIPGAAKNACESNVDATRAYYEYECKKYCRGCAYSFGLYQTTLECEYQGYSWKSGNFKYWNGGTYYCDCA